MTAELTPADHRFVQHFFQIRQHCLTVMIQKDMSIPELAQQADLSIERLEEILTTVSDLDFREISKLEEALGIDLIDLPF